MNECVFCLVEFKKECEDFITGRVPKSDLITGKSCGYWAPFKTNEDDRMSGVCRSNMGLFVRVIQHMLYSQRYIILFIYVI